MRTRECAEVEREGRRERERDRSSPCTIALAKKREREREREGDGEINENVERGDDDKECSSLFLSSPFLAGWVAWPGAGLGSGQKQPFPM